jgi:hypothetical protein
MMRTKTVYLLSGSGDVLDSTLGRVITGLGFAVQSRAIASDVQAMLFSEPLLIVEADLRAGCWGCEGSAHRTFVRGLCPIAYPRRHALFTPQAESC